MSKKIKNKIGYCDNRYLGINRPGGHYVYIRKNNYNGTCDVNVVTSLENKNKKYSIDKLHQVKKGNTYPIPVKDANFTKWSGINHDVIKNVKVAEIQDIGKKRIKRKHNFYIDKFMK